MYALVSGCEMRCDSEMYVQKRNDNEGGGKGNKDDNFEAGGQERGDRWRGDKWVGGGKG